MAVFVIMALIGVGCAGPQERGGGASGHHADKPAREAKAPTTDAGVPPVAADGDYNCADFQTRTQARAVLERDPGDPYYLDGDGNGVPCEELPAGSSAFADAGSPSVSASVPASAPSAAAGAQLPPSTSDRDSTEPRPDEGR